MYVGLPEEVATEINRVREGVVSFLGQEGEEMTEIMWKIALERLVITGQLPLPCTLTEAAAFLGSHDTTSLLRKGTEER